MLLKIRKTERKRARKRHQVRERKRKENRGKYIRRLKVRKTER